MQREKALIRTQLQQKSKTINFEGGHRKVKRA